MTVVSGPTPTRQQALALLRGFLLNTLPANVDVIIAQANRVPEPAFEDYVVLTGMGLSRLATTVQTWGPGAPIVMNSQQSVQLEVQMDVHGVNSTDNTNIITTLLRSPYGVDFFNPSVSGIAPFWCDEGRQIPFISGEHQFEDRWVLSAFFGLNINLTTPQQFADTLTAGIIEVDSTYPP